MKKSVAIAGNIGVGKSTLVELLCVRLGWEPFYEPVTENPYLADFYADMDAWSFHSQVFFLATRLRSQYQLAQHPSLVIQDRSVYEDAEIFAQNLFLQGHINERDFKTYRSLYESTTRTFANIRIKNQLLKGVEGGLTKHIPAGEQLSIYDAAMKYMAAGTPLVVFAGKEYGTGSSRDWAGKGTILLGVKAVVAESFERIHRSNLIGMGVLPLQFKDSDTWSSLGLTGDEEVTVHGVDKLTPRSEAKITIRSADGKSRDLTVRVRIDTADELDYYLHGGILQYVVRQLAAA